MKCYVLGAATGSAENAEALYNVYKKALQNRLTLLGTPIETMQFKGTFKERFLRAKKLVGEAELLIADVTSASTGAGFEIGLAYMLNKKIIIFAENGSKVSGLIIGMAGEENIIYYSNHANLEQKLKSINF